MSFKLFKIAQEMLDYETVWERIKDYERLYPDDLVPFTKDDLHRFAEHCQEAINSAGEMGSRVRASWLRRSQESHTACCIYLDDNELQFLHGGPGVTTCSAYIIFPPQISPAPEDWDEIISKLNEGWYNILPEHTSIFDDLVSSGNWRIAVSSGINSGPILKYVGPAKHPAIK